MNNLLNTDIDVKILSEDLKNVEFTAVLRIEDKCTILKFKSNIKIQNLNSVCAKLNDGTLLYLIHGVINSTHSSSFASYKTIRFYETLYLADYFKDEYFIVKCQVPLLNNWFNPKYYESTSSADHLIFNIQNEKEFTINFNEFEIKLYYQARINFGQFVHIKPQTYLIISSKKLLERYELFDILNSAKYFYQSFFLERFLVFNLFFECNNSTVVSHSIKFPYKAEIDLQGRCTTWFQFNEIKNDLSKLFQNWMVDKEQNTAIEDLFYDAFKNTSPINRFLSSMRILEILAKRIKDKVVKEKALQWKQSIISKQILRENENKFSQYWILKPFILYNENLEIIPDTEIIDIINNRNYYTHGNYKIDGIVNPEFLQKLTTKILGISKTVFFLQLGIKNEMVHRVMHSFNYSYYFDPIDNKESSFYQKDSNNS